MARGAAGTPTGRAVAGVGAAGAVRPLEQAERVLRRSRLAASLTLASLTLWDVLGPNAIEYSDQGVRRPAGWPGARMMP
jgi:hypothetical protein